MTVEKAMKRVSFNKYYTEYDFKCDIKKFSQCIQKRKVITDISMSNGASYRVNIIVFDVIKGIGSQKNYNLMLKAIGFKFANGNYGSTMIVPNPNMCIKTMIMNRILDFGLRNKIITKNLHNKASTVL
jgi:hypothetical protein